MTICSQNRCMVAFFCPKTPQNSCMLRQSDLFFGLFCPFCPLLTAPAISPLFSPFCSVFRLLLHCAPARRMTGGRALFPYLPHLLSTLFLPVFCPLRSPVFHPNFRPFCPPDHPCYFSLRPLYFAPFFHSFSPPDFSSCRPLILPFLPSCGEGVPLSAGKKKASLARGKNTPHPLGGWGVFAFTLC